ncbi:hypothetical protein QQ994_07530 [Pseudomonas asiatica]|uniref:hypothetical protein n=1 Tax=Pseudomonas asiatica TaxID=2219225 RepID=UPI0025701B88|nr:hypothetical protein [Pseudomonas asiatica]WJD71705.1 hypothetical protein QQ994_07530 [Pseudomonas asiatica]
MEQTRRRCEALIIDGRQCKLSASEGKSFCAVHIRARRSKWLKKVQGGAELAKATAKVISAATSVYVAYQAVAPYWDDFLKELSHYINFLHDTDDEGAHRKHIEAKTRSLKAYVESMRSASSTQDITDACNRLLSTVQYEHHLATRHSRLNPFEWRKEQEKSKPLIGIFADDNDAAGTCTFEAVVGGILHHTSELEKAFADYKAAAKFVSDHVAATDPQEPQ